MNLALRVLGAVYLTVGCAWAWRFTGAFAVGRWRITLRGLRGQHGMPYVPALGVTLVFWLYDGIADVVLWPLGIHSELKFQRWLRTAVPSQPRASEAPIADVGLRDPGPGTLPQVVRDDRAADEQ